MTSHLPEQPDRWPTDPFILLGVSRAADLRELRRAYSALIRQFRPETHPEQFQRIRQAYEAAQLRLEHSDRDHGSPPNSPPSAPPADTNPRASGSAPVPFTPVPFDSDAGPAARAASGANDDQADLVWKQFSERPHVSQYQGLAELRRRETASSRTLLMGYWMLRLRPHFDARSRPVDWLEAGVRQFPDDARFISLLVDELDRDPGLVHAALLTNLSHAIRDLRTLTVYLLRRWAILSELRSWERLQLELRDVRPRLAFDNPSAWFALLFLVCRMSRRERDGTGQELHRQVNAELEELARSQPASDPLLTQYDALMSSAPRANWPPHHEPLNELLMQACSFTLKEFRQKLHATVSTWINLPAHGLSPLSFVAAEHPENFWLFCHQLSRLGIPQPQPAPDLRDIGALVIGLINRCGKEGYPNSRIGIVEFCRNQCLSSQQLLDILSGLDDRHRLAGQLHAALLSDLPVLVTADLIFEFLQSSAGRGSSLSHRVAA